MLMQEPSWRFLRCYNGRASQGSCCPFFRGLGFNSGVGHARLFRRLAYALGRRRIGEQDTSRAEIRSWQILHNIVPRCEFPSDLRKKLAVLRSQP